MLEILQDLRDKKVLVIGAGLSGQAAAVFLAAKGADVTLTDNKTVADLFNGSFAITRCWFGLSGVSDVGRGVGRRFAGLFGL